MSLKATIISLRAILKVTSLRPILKVTSLRPIIKTINVGLFFNNSHVRGSAWGF